MRAAPRGSGEAISREGGSISLIQTRTGEKRSVGSWEATLPCVRGPEPGFGVYVCFGGHLKKVNQAEISSVLA